MHSAEFTDHFTNVKPLAYHTDIHDFLRGSDPDVWKWLSSHHASAKHAEDVRFELLKSTYRIERDSQPELYQTAEEVANRFGINAPITIYQTQSPQGLNASLAYVPGEVHLVLHGPITSQLTPLEVRGLFAHELAHFVLWSIDQGAYLTTNEMLVALISDAKAHSAHFASWRLFGLYTEIYCDRAALAVTQDIGAVVSMLVKVGTGISEVQADSYLRQADEVFTHGDASSKGVTHPEAFIRARAIRLWGEAHADTESLIKQMIEGTPEMDELDLLEQTRVFTLTRRILDALLCRKWFQTDLVLAHARLYFEDYSPPSDPLRDTALAKEIRIEPASLCEYYCFLLLDFITADRELEEPPLAAALQLAEELGIKPKLMELVRRELKLRKNQLDRVDKNKETILAEIERTATAMS